MKAFLRKMVEPLALGLGIILVANSIDAEPIVKLIVLVMLCYFALRDAMRRKRRAPALPDFKREEFKPYDRLR